MQNKIFPFDCFIQKIGSFRSGGCYWAYLLRLWYFQDNSQLTLNQSPHEIPSIGVCSLNSLLRHLACKNKWVVRWFLYDS
jgi:hypothetical protein